jgi:hypothetical protein
VTARTLESVITESGFNQIDFLSLDVEGYEIEVLRGMNIERYRPNYMMIEGTGPDRILPVLGGYYDFVEMVTSQDVLLKAKR